MCRLVGTGAGWPYSMCKLNILGLACLPCRSISWNYCILDEGHIIKNPKAKVWFADKHTHTHTHTHTRTHARMHTHTHTHTHTQRCTYLYHLSAYSSHEIFTNSSKITKAVKELKSNHRLILTGTPIQVSVLTGTVVRPCD